MQRIKLFLLSTALVLLLLPVSATTARQDDSSNFLPASGPPGTDIIVACNGTAYLTSPSRVNGSADIASARATDPSGDTSFVARQLIAVITVPADTPTGRYQIECLQPTSDARAVYPDLFIVTDCPLANANNQSTISIAPIQQLTGIAQFQGTDLGTAANGQFGRTLDITNAFNETLRVIVRGNNATEVLTYINSLSLDFKANPIAGGTLNSCNNNLSNLGVQGERTVSGDIDVEFVLLQGGAISAGQQYVVSYTIDPEVRQDKVHTYQPIQTTSASARVTAQSGGVKLTLWSDAGFVNAITVSENLPKLPALVNSINPEETQYYAVVRGVENFSNTYEIQGSFGTEPCAPGQRECGEVIEPELALLQNGIGGTDGSPMNDGNFQVEFYCRDGLFDDFASYTETERNNENWFCVNPTDGARVTLEQANFTEICQLTYNRSDAIAISDAGNDIPAFNWRCFGRN